MQILPQPPIHQERFSLAASEIAAALGIRPQGIRKKLERCGIPATGKRCISGNIADVWELSTLPVALHTPLARLATRGGYASIQKMFQGGLKVWTPPIPLAEISDDCLTKANSLKCALLPSLQRQFVLTQADFERDGVTDYEKIFGVRISTKHFRQLVKRTVERDGGQENWERIELYLPKKPARKQALPEAKLQFHSLVSVLSSGATPDEIWKAAFKIREELVKAGNDPARVDRQLRALLIERAPSLAPTPDALLKTYGRRHDRWQSAQPFDKRAEANGAEDSELTRQIKSLGWFVPVAQFFYLLTNRTKDSGSMPEAIRRTISLPTLPAGWKNRTKSQFLRALKRTPYLQQAKLIPVCPDDLRAQILARQKAGKPMIPESLAHLIRVCPATVRQHRHVTNTSLDYLSSPGSLFFIHDSRTGERRPPHTGEVIECDDGTINFPVCVPWTLGGDPCSDKFDVKVGRFQWLLSRDAASRFIPAYSYTMRPRGSYRAEDVVSLMRAYCNQHGKPGRFRFEQGAWKSHLVKNTLKAAGIELQTVTSPHQKPYIEGLFNVLWTKLSVHFPDAHVGRFRGENKEANDLLVSCQRGSHDPRRYFPMLSDAIAAFDEVIREQNQTPVKSDIGRWIPAEKWEARTRGGNLSEQDFQLFAPWQRTWTVKGMSVGGKIPLFEDLSVPFDFSAPWLPKYHGAKVRCHFDPTQPRCNAMLVLSENFHGEPAGKILGQAQQINEVAGYVRLVLGYGDDPTDAGRRAKQQAASALRREVRTIIPRGGSHSISEARDGISQVGIIERNGNGTEVLRGGKETSAAVLAKNLSDDERKAKSEQRKAELAEKVAYVEKFERENQHLFI